jgi:hypothetical protein
LVTRHEVCHGAEFATDLGRTEVAVFDGGGFEGRKKHREDVASTCERGLDSLLLEAAAPECSSLAERADAILAAFASEAWLASGATLRPSLTPRYRGSAPLPEGRTLGGASLFAVNQTRVWVPLRLVDSREYKYSVLDLQDGELGVPLDPGELPTSTIPGLLDPSLPFRWDVLASRKVNDGLDVALLQSRTTGASTVNVLDGERVVPILGCVDPASGMVVSGGDLVLVRAVGRELAFESYALGLEP